MESCLICGSADTKRIVSFQNGGEIIKCGNCRNAFTFPQPKPPDYENMDFHAREVIDDEMPCRQFEEIHEEQRLNYFTHLHFIGKYLLPGSKILEIGCGEGIFADLLIRENYEYTGIEPSKTAFKRAKSKGLNVINSYYPLEGLNKKYDLIIMSHVLEHLENPLEIIKSFDTYLEPEGLIFLLQTNYNGFWPFVFREKWYAWVPSQHLWHFTPKGISYISNLLEMHVLDYGFTSLNHYHWVRRFNKIVKIIPSFRDQFHIMLRMNR